EVPPGAAVISLRTAAVKLLRLESGLVVIGAGKRAAQLSSETVAKNTWILSAKQGAADDVEVAKVGSTGWLVSRRDQSPRYELDLETQTLQHLSTRHIAWMLQRYRVDCVLDVGANNGQYAQGLRRHGYEGHI